MFCSLTAFVYCFFFHVPEAAGKEASETSGNQGRREPNVTSDGGKGCDVGYPECRPTEGYDVLSVASKVVGIPWYDGVLNNICDC